MKTFRLLLLTSLSCLLFACNDSDSVSNWQMKESSIMTTWASEVDEDSPWNVYPRPYLERDNWTNLNGLWEYAITNTNSERPIEMDGEILVPYPVESAISGVMQRVSKDDLIWYKRELNTRKLKKSEHLILHFEAVDWHSTIWIDDKKIGEHKGGYSHFSFDITDYINPSRKQELWLSVWDPSSDGTQAVGKQNSNPHGIWYTPSSGIWQTVWLEKVNDSYITDYKAITDIDQGRVEINTEIMGAQAEDQLEMTIRNGGRIIAKQKYDISQKIVIDIPNHKLWTPDDPFLYDLEIKLERKMEVIDQINGYFGMRKISLGKDEKGITRIMLNNEFVFQNGPLDQGFWPDGLYTPPTEEAMVYDLKILKEMGFNMLRKHVKVENRRFYYWTDKIGLLVWQDMPNAHFGINVNDIKSQQAGALQFEKELQELIFSRDNHPSIIIWVPFNEGWGQYDTERIVDYVAALDSTRLIINSSGWTDMGVGHILDIHHYPNPIAPAAEENRAIVLGEFGGLGLPVKNHTWKQDQNWGYENMEGTMSLLSKYEAFYQEVAKLAENPGLSAVVYTQTTDVEIETNGLMTYDRKVDKMGKEYIQKAHLGYIPPALTNPIAEFIDSYTIELSCAKPCYQIHYTTDGSLPDRSSKLYAIPMTITESIVLKAIAFWENGEESRPSEFKINKVDK
ncbi:MAG: chitobiase/beta-hexosaminidase C-terminal domain-containing protein [Bacteroidales bacterium]|nr:chitobiase/beta-hexosaminidase C-terminal domain-containing protein [Bacteroidales bacterium]